MDEPSTEQGKSGKEVSYSESKVFKPLYLIYTQNESDIMSLYATISIV